MPKAKELEKAQGGGQARGGASVALEAALGLLEHLPLPVFIKDRDGRYLAVNRAWEKFFGVPRAEFLGKSLAELYPTRPEIAARHAAKDAELWRDCGGQSYEIPITTRSGDKRDTIYYKAAFGRDFPGLLGVIVDVTARREAEDALRSSKLLLEQVFDNMDQGISVADGSLRMVAMNRRFRELLDFPESLCQPNTPFERFIRYNAERGEYGPGDVEEQVRTRVELARSPRAHRFTRRRPDGTVIEVRGVPLPEGGFVTVYTDITERFDSDERLRESEERFRRTFEIAGSGIAHFDMERRFIRCNRRVCEIFGRSEAEILGRTAREFSHPDDLDIINTQRKRLYAGEIDTVRAEKRYLKKDGTPVWVAYAMVAERDAAGRPLYEIAVFDDITSQKEAEARLRESEERFRSVVNSANEGILVYDRKLDIVAGNQAAERIIGVPLADLIGAAGFTSLLPCVYPDGTPLAAEDRPTKVTVRTGRPLSGYVVGVKRADGRTSWLSVSTAFLRHPGASDWYGIVSTVADITSQRDAEARIRESEERFRQTFELAASGISHVIDGKFVRVNRRLCEILGRREEDLIGRSVKEVSHPEDRDVTDADRARIRRGEIESARFEKRYIRGDGAVIWAEVVIALVRDAAGRPLYEIAIFDDISERKRAEAALQAAHEELKRSNAELEQFAYVASHDLQEPLRMVSSYTQLVLRRYGERLDGDAREFMRYVVDGAARMKQLIEDLLAYSRVGTRGKGFVAVPVDVPLRRALVNLRNAMEEASAAVTWDPLPTVHADDGQLAQLFQNLIANALKFRSASVPRIHVSAAEHGAEWEFAVSDNGIGIEPQYFERIFMVFQRLHNKTEYPGTGIGLAICRKVVERHGGRIWVEAHPGQGTTFRFTLPKEARHG
ncbi:MAG: PAS domain S-box protein [Betaproteobacteria bacterium]